MTLSCLGQNAIKYYLELIAEKKLYLVSVANFVIDLSNKMTINNWKKASDVLIEDNQRQLDSRPRLASNN